MPTSTRPTPSETDTLLSELRRQNWTLYVFGPKTSPEVIAAVFRWKTCADVVILRGENDATAYRVPTMLGADVFAPELVSWQYHSSAVWTLRAVLALAPAGDARAPMAVLRPDPLCFLPPELDCPVTVRPTSPSGATRRRDEVTS